MSITRALGNGVVMLKLGSQPIIIPFDSAPLIIHSPIYGVWVVVVWMMSVGILLCGAVVVVACGGSADRSAVCESGRYAGAGYRCCYRCRGTATCRRRTRDNRYGQSRYRGNDCATTTCSWCRRGHCNGDRVGLGVTRVARVILIVVESVLVKGFRFRLNHVHDRAANGCCVCGSRCDTAACCCCCTCCCCCRSCRRIVVCKQ